MHAAISATSMPPLRSERNVSKTATGHSDLSSTWERQRKSWFSSFSQICVIKITRLFSVSQNFPSYKWSTNRFGKMILYQVHSNWCRCVSHSRLLCFGLNAFCRARSTAQTLSRWKIRQTTDVKFERGEKFLNKFLIKHNLIILKRPKLVEIVFFVIFGV